MADSEFDGSWELVCQTVRGKSFLGASLDIQGMQVELEIEGKKETFPAMGLISGRLSVEDQTKGSFRYDAEMYCVTLLEDILMAGSVRRRGPLQSEDDDTDVFIATRKPTEPQDGE